MYINLITIDLCPGQGGGGVNPSGTLDITSNGMYNVYSYASANVSVPFYTETLSVSENGTYIPGTGIDGYSQVEVDVPMTGITEKEVTEGIQVVNLSNSASYVHTNVFAKDTYLQTVNLPNCTVVGAEAFRECSNLTTVNLPVCTGIDNSAFNNCTALTTINMPLITYLNNTVFNNCTSLTSIYLPVCKNIGQSAFALCTSLTSIYLPMCETIVNGAFSGCRSLNSLTLCTDVYWTIPYQSRMLSNTPIISGTGSIYVRSDTYSLWITSTGWSSLSDRFVSVETSGIILSFSEGTVYGTTNVLKSDFINYIGVRKTDVVNLSLENCKTIYDRALMQYSNLTTVSLPVCTSISYNAFTNCTSLTSIDLPMCEYIGNSVFSSCSSLSQVNLSVCTSIGDNAFANCTSLTSIDLPMCEYINYGAFRSCSSLSQVNLPVCTSIGDSAFKACYTLSSLNLSICSHIGIEAFRYCSSLSQVNLPMCEYIDNQAFQDVYSANYNLPVCSYIGVNAFRTYSFITITLGYSGVVSLGGNPFEDSFKRVSIYVPASLVDAYKSANYWSVYESQIFPIE